MPANSLRSQPQEYLRMQQFLRQQFEDMSDLCKNDAWVPVVPLIPRNLSSVRTRLKFFSHKTKSCSQRHARLPTVCVKPNVANSLCLSANSPNVFMQPASFGNNSTTTRDGHWVSGSLAQETYGVVSDVACSSAQVNNGSGGRTTRGIRMHVCHDFVSGEFFFFGGRRKVHIFNVVTQLLQLFVHGIKITCSAWASKVQRVLHVVNFFLSLKLYFISVDAYLVERGDT
ncbi:hypothetical protein AGLY_013940 [Aphis glycines]|uniref:Uncharacterized protein n=1 Tax=Aphis glycines TaxID=307491 RepID=A0A6G0T6T0_APHGL|nr:hypothetical protein AGLY_013940 [Aphis glycines]